MKPETMESVPLSYATVLFFFRRGTRAQGLKLKKYFLLVFIFFFGCSGNIVLLPRPDGSLPLVSVNIQILDISQKPFADTLGSLLVKRLQLFAEERKDFRLISSQESTDYKLILKITNLSTVKSDKQLLMKNKREIIERKYDKINDSIQAAYKPMTTGQLIAANIATNVIANAILLPLGFVSITVVENTGPRLESTSKEDSKAIDSTFSRAKVAYEVELIQNDGKLLWKKKYHNEFKLNYMINEQEQIDVLLRNITLSLDDKMPLFKIRK